MLKESAKDVEIGRLILVIRVLLQLEDLTVFNINSCVFSIEVYGSDFMYGLTLD